MNAKRLLIFAVVALAIAVTVCLGFDAYYKRKQPVFKNTPKLFSAVTAFSQDLSRRGQALPAAVSVEQLISGGYLLADDVRAFQGVDVQIWLSGDDLMPDRVLLSAKLPDGSINAALADGSVQQFSPQRFKAQLRKTGQLDGSPSRTHPVFPETNSAPTAATAGP